MRCILWERNLRHSIRPEIGDGFLLPYHDLMALAAKDASVNLAEYVLSGMRSRWALSM